MKKIIKRFWGVALAIVLLSSMLISVIPASAGTLSWGYANLPGGTIGPLKATNPNSIFAPTYWSSFLGPCVIYDIAVASDGKTIYAATSFGGFKTTNGGRTWSDLFTHPFWSLFGMDSTKLMATTRVAVAPDNANLVVFLNTASNTFALSSAGGSNLYVGPVTDYAGNNATAITDVDICPKTTIHGQSVNLVLVTGTTASGAALFYLNYGVDFSGWDECLTGRYAGAAENQTFDDHFTAGATRFVTVKHSPNFARDYVAYLVGDNGTAPSMDIVSFNSNQFNSGVPSYQYYPDAGVVLDANAPATYLDMADIVFDPNFLAGNEESRFTYISLDFHTTGAYLGGLYRVTDNAMPVVTWNLVSNGNALITPTAAASVWSISINADGSMLAAAAGYYSTTWTVTGLKGNPTAIAPVPSRLVKRSGGGANEGFSSTSDNQIIAFAADGVVLARSGTYSGAFALSRDNGYTYNDIGMLNFIATDINDHAVNANGVERYVVASGNLSATGNATSVFYWDGTYWERTLTIKNTAPNGYLIGASPNNFNVLYLANMTTAMIRYTSTAGRVNWLERTSPVPTTGLADMAVQDDATLWVATQVDGNGCVTKLSETGNIWPTGPPYFNAVFGTIYHEAISTITLISPNNLVAGGLTGHVAYSMFGGAFWMPLTATVPSSGPVHATADSVGTGGTIYAVGSTDNNIYTWVIGTSLAWYDQVDPVISDTQVPKDLQIYNGAMYYCSTNGDTSYLGRALMPALDETDVSEWGFSQIRYSATDPFTQSVTSWTPDPLKFSLDATLGYGNKIWVTDALGCDAADLWVTPTPAPDQIMVFTDTLVTYAVPILSKAEILIEVNRETGYAYNANVSWTAIPYKYYEFEVFYDRACTHFFDSDTFFSGERTTIDITVGPHSADFPINYQPGESFYYRVRVATPFYSPWSEVHSLDVQPIRAPIPELYSPANGGTVPYLRPGFSWTPMGAYTKTYHIQIATSYTFEAASIVVDANIDASSVDGAGYGLSKDLVDGKQYFWHVQVLEPFPGDWSTVGNFWVKLPTAPTTQMVTVPGPTTVILTATQPAATSLTVTAPVSENVVNPSYIWAIIIIGAVLVIAVIVLIFRTRRV